MSSKRDNYRELKEVLKLAILRASHGKGLERHADGKPFIQQTMAVANRVTNCGFSWGQIYKKLLEIPNLQTEEAKVNEMLDVIVYAAGYVLIKKEWIDRENLRYNNFSSMVDNPTDTEKEG